MTEVLPGWSSIAPGAPGAPSTFHAPQRASACLSDGASPAPTAFPEFSIRATSGDKAEAVWTKGQFDGVKIEVDRGAAGLLTDTDLRPNYTVNWLPPAGTSAIIKIRMRYIYKGEDFGNWSPWQNWTLTGA